MAGRQPRTAGARRTAGCRRSRSNFRSRIHRERERRPSTARRRTLNFWGPAWNAVTCSNSGIEALSFSIQRKGVKTPAALRSAFDEQSLPSPIRYRASGLATGSDRIMTACIREKIAVVPPMPRASVSTAVSVKTGARRNCLKAYRSRAMNILQTLRCYPYICGLLASPARRGSKC